ncbi:hypothetical protein [Ekhidna sp.]|uniref:hypothetical protein n=1 Tax=Ekhidna sp. TaxID=2608089 RepID=UPI003C7B9FDE
MKKNSPIITALIIVLTLFTSSCKEDEPAAKCEQDNTGTLIVKNNYGENPNSSNSLLIFVNREPRSSNEAGDVTIPYGETGELTLPAGIHAIKVYLNTGSCSGNRCSVSREYLGEREVDLDQCEELNLAYGS